MKAIKDNKSYRIEEHQKKWYLADGYDIFSDNGELIEYSPLKKITLQQHIEALEKLKKELEANSGNDDQISKYKDKIEELNKELAGIATPETVMLLLQNYANSKGVDLGSTTSESGVLDKILKSEKV